MGIYNNNQQSIQEVFFGKTKELQALEKSLKVIRSDFFKNGTKTNSLPSIQKFNRLVESTFGIKRFALRIDFSFFGINAYTIPVSIKLDNIGVSKKYITNKNSIKFAEDTNYCCIVNISYGMMLEEDITDGEMLAIILHEIGHNFSSCLSSKSAMLSSIKKSLISIEIIMNVIQAFITDNPESRMQRTTDATVFTLFMLNSFDKLKLKILENDIVNDSLSTVSLIMGLLNSIKGFINTFTLLLNPIRYIMTILFNSLITIINYLPPIYFIKLLGYREEQMADSFATMYGYGPELISGLSKISRPSKAENSALCKLNELMLMPLILLSIPVEEHPDEISRIKNNLDYLKKELKDCDPRMRKEINQQIDEIETMLEETIEECKKANVSTHGFTRKIYSIFVHDHFGGDPRDIIFKNDTHEQIDVHYKSKLR